MNLKVSLIALFVASGLLLSFAEQIYVYEAVVNNNMTNRQEKAMLEDASIITAIFDSLNEGYTSYLAGEEMDVDLLGGSRYLRNTQRELLSQCPNYCA